LYFYFSSHLNSGWGGGGGGGGGGGNAADYLNPPNHISQALNGKTGENMASTIHSFPDSGPGFLREPQRASEIPGIPEILGILSRWPGWWLKTKHFRSWPTLTLEMNRMEYSDRIRLALRL